MAKISKCALLHLAQHPWRITMTPPGELRVCVACRVREMCRRTGSPTWRCRCGLGVALAILDGPGARVEHWKVFP
jgi:hypothetical protein